MMDLAAYEVCYSALGFVFGVAKCFAHESTNKWPSCGKYCHDFMTEKTMACQNCLDKVRTEREDCTLNYMGISQPCKQCYHNARDYWKNNCMLQCIEPNQMCQDCEDRVDQKNKRMQFRIGMKQHVCFEKLCYRFGP